jgi:hypothetical protein
MNDIYIYKQKAEKYKYKYLKLKQELYGGGDPCSYILPITFDNNRLIIDDDKQSGKINKKLNIKINYRAIDSPNADFYTYNKEGYIGQLFKYKNYNIILNNLEILKKISNIDLSYIDIVFGCTIFKEEQESIISSNYIRTIFKDCEHILKNNIFKKSKDRFGYIISTYPGKNINIIDLIKSKSDLIKFITDLINALEKFIIPLHNERYFLNNIDLNNIKWNAINRKIFFNILKIEENKNNNNIDIKALINNIKKINIDYYNSESMKCINKKLNDSILTADQLKNTLSVILLYLNKDEIELNNSMIKYDNNNKLTNKFTSEQANEEKKKLNYDNNYDNEITNINNKIMTIVEEEKRNNYKNKIIKDLQIRYIFQKDEDEDEDEE